MKSTIRRRKSPFILPMSSSVSGASSYSPITAPFDPSTSTSGSSVSPWVFWALGLLNNTSYVIMSASASSISEGGTALVFVASSLPSLLLKISAPYWFDRVSYQTRLSSATLLMISAFFIVGMFDSSHRSNYTLAMQLIGVALISLQCGMGEASLLALAGKCDAGRRKKACLTAFSSGTGVAGMFGFLWKFVWNDWLGLSLTTTIYLAIPLALSYWFIFYKHLWGVKSGQIVVEPANVPVYGSPRESLSVDDDVSQFVNDESSSVEEFRNDAPELSEETVIRIDAMTTLQRMKTVLGLWPYMIPLFTVYFAEYALQAGTWTAIGFPVEDKVSRDQFFEYSNWVYQVGVFLSRSSGTLFTAPLLILWLMPALQCVNVAFFWWVAKYQVFYNMFLLIPAFYVGLLGGAVYVNGYTRICADLPLEHREFALSSTSVAEGFGIVSADILGLFLQACLYKIHHIDGAVATCPLRNP